MDKKKDEKTTIVKKKPIKLITLGESKVGKTSIIRRFHKDEFTFQTQSTLGVDCVTKKVRLTDSKVMDIQIWDTAGQERYHVITPMFYQNSRGVLLVFDVTGKTSFQRIHKWIKSIKQSRAGDKIIKYLIGNKIDMEEDRVISREQAEELAKEYDMKYFETSAYKRIGVQEAIESLVREIHEGELTDKIQKRTSFQLKKLENEKKDADTIKKCCHR